MTTTPIVTRVEDLAEAIGRDVGGLVRAGAGTVAARVARLAEQQLAILDALETLIGRPSGSAATTATSGTGTAIAWPKGADGLALLPKPRIVEVIDYEAILARRKADLVAAVARERALAVRRGDTRTVADLDQLGEYLVLESVPETILLEEAAYGEMLIRFRANEMYLSRLVYWSGGSDLDNNAEEHGVTRLEGEPDADLKLRVRIKNRGSSAAGPDDWWRYHAMRAHEEVEDVAVTRPAFPYPAPSQQRGHLVLSILAESIDGTPSAEVLDAVRSVVNSPAVRGATTGVTVRAATSRVVDIAADVWLRPDAPPGTFDGLRQGFIDAWAATRGLGWDVTGSWIVARLMAPGVQRVTLIGWADVAMAADEAPRLGQIVLTNRGYAF